ncbi:MAG: sigma-70 family RNA polymerase sigma factor [bacterium]|nr:sigma-70 family RNA polymerase sigma factor [Candidatus Kapabacteria bacterium]
MSASDSITRLLEHARAGDAAALDSLLPLVYDELLRLARAQLRSERQGHTLNTTALVHEAYIKLVDQQSSQWQSRGHFFAVAAMAMRRILVNYARAKHRQKRGGHAPHVPIDDTLVIVAEERADVIVALDDALNRLTEVNARAGKVVECRYFAGLSIEETADALEISAMTVKRDWLLAKTWLRREIGDEIEP